MRRIFFMALLLLTYAASGAEVSKNESVPGWDSIDTSQDCVVILDKSGPTAALTCVTNKLVAMQQQMESLDDSSALKAATVALQRQFDSKLKAQQQQNDAAIAELKQQNEVLQQAEEQSKQLSAKVQALKQQVEELQSTTSHKGNNAEVSAQVQALQQRVDGDRAKPNVAVPIDMVSGGLPVNGTFSSNGGKILITANGSGYTAGDAGLIGMNIVIDGVAYGQAKSFTNENHSHKAFVMKSLLVGGIIPGSHTITLSSWNNTNSDYNDFYTVTVIEFRD